MLPGLRGATRRLLTPARTMCTYSERMDKLGKPVSPHITIYAWPTIAISSVFMRTTGILLSIGAHTEQRREQRGCSSPQSSACV